MLFSAAIGYVQYSIYWLIFSQKKKTKTVSVCASILHLYECLIAAQFVEIFYTQNKLYNELLF